ncbi:7,8-dihydropterin-6-yl-methyl-4-(beta-D-ribofuranosyl)aminobenzene 5'-phosphate synthase [Methanofollis sp. W23]|uniref:MBL fold metallo-hydrolase n=1 Tax=Methanofollis sp. W23 TaxID=2817849 RepID=UPI001AE3D490|nr:MBL fold metallo-hydrolase [Methanofollis sp. W23]MBP2146639.1 7,8-dihydropterin-6-yl-methyl-4-(beta-D-ribofuranosyl)aminobenzene 5'-phosphate synthase [Methanofollis sp. W23]
MDITLLCDNTVLTDHYYLGEPGLSVHIKDQETEVLFDLGYSDVFLRNALAMGIAPCDAEYVVFSHCHLDHTWGLGPLLRHHVTTWSKKKPEFLGHPALFRSVQFDGDEIGMVASEETLARYGTVRLSHTPVEITDEIVFLGEIPRRFCFEGRTAIGTSEGVPDLVPDDTALACRTDDGLVVVTGCAHAGICATVEYAREVSGEEKVADVIGGFHLLDASPAQIEATCRYFGDLGADQIHPCHCTGLPATLALARVAKVCETGVGLRLSFGPRS